MSRETSLHEVSWVDPAGVRTTEETVARVESDGTVVLFGRTTRGTHTDITPVLSLDGRTFTALAGFVANQERDQP